MKYRVIEETRDHVVVHKDHRLANASYVKLSDFKDDTFIMVSPEDSEESPNLIIDACKMSGFNPQVKFASSVQEEMLWVQAGVGVCILDSRNLLSNNDTVRFLNTDIISDMGAVDIEGTPEVLTKLAIQVTTDMGDIDVSERLNGKVMENETDILQTFEQKVEKATGSLTIETNSGDISVDCD